MDITSKIDKYLGEGMAAKKMKLFDWFWGLSVQDVIKNARELSDDDLKSLYGDGKHDGYSGSPRDIQVRTIEKEMKKRGFIK